MFKRVAIVFALLFAQIAAAETSTTSPADALSVASATDTPVVELSATGTVISNSLGTTSSSTELSPAETARSSKQAGTSTATTSEFGAFGTSTGSTTVTVVETTTETEESTIDPTDEETQRLFALVYAGFEEFVRITLGWE